MATAVLASIGDHGALNASLPTGLQGVWLDRDLSWLDFNERALRSDCHVWRGKVCASCAISALMGGRDGFPDFGPGKKRKKVR
jgi:hypothetical protein